MRVDPTHEIRGPSPQERLAISRRMLVEQLLGSREPRGRRAESIRASSAAKQIARPFLRGSDWLPLARRLVTHWWQRHPLHAAGQVARPVVERVARERPAALMATAASVGALVVLTRPWRLLTVSAAVAALLKTSELAGVINTLMDRSSSPRKESTS